MRSARWMLTREMMVKEMRRSKRKLPGIGIIRKR